MKSIKKDKFYWTFSLLPWTNDEATAGNKSTICMKKKKWSTLNGSYGANCFLNKQSIKMLNNRLNMNNILSSQTDGKQYQDQQNKNKY